MTELRTRWLQLWREKDPDIWEVASHLTLLLFAVWANHPFWLRYQSSTNIALVMWHWLPPWGWAVILGSIGGTGIACYFMEHGLNWRIRAGLAACTCWLLMTTIFWMSEPKTLAALLCPIFLALHVWAVSRLKGLREHLEEVKSGCPASPDA
jgi:uncharacterized membrane-anchored protein YitT (DUF2179 family)